MSGLGEVARSAFAGEVGVSLQFLKVEDASPVGPADTAPSLSCSVEALLRELPTAHPAPPIGSRSVISLHQLTSAMRESARPLACQRIRFVYFPSHAQNTRREAYHRRLVVAEVLLNRVLSARANGLHPLAPTLTRAVEARVFHRPPRQLLRAGTLEYRRWYDSHDQPRAQPLTIEALSAWLVRTEGITPEAARQVVIGRSRALTAREQMRVLARRQAPVESRPLNQNEFRLLVESLDAACRAPAGAPSLERANREIARRAVAMLADLLDEFTASPFVTPELDRTFSAFHVDSLRRGIESSRQSESLLIGPRAWFAAKSARMQAEHQMGLALAPVITDVRARFKAAAMRIRLALKRQVRQAATG
jgi:hypothetical protein